LATFLLKGHAMSREASFSGLLLIAVLASWPASMVSAQTNDRPYSDLESEENPDIRPGDDFFGYANGAWLKATRIPAGRERWTNRNEIDELTRGQILQLLDGAGTQPVGSTARKVADFRAAYLNVSAIEARGLAPLKSQLDSINRIQDKNGLTRHLGRGMLADVDPLNWGIYRSSSLLGLSVEPGINGERTNVAFLLQGGLGLPDREHYVSSDLPMQALRGEYQQYISHLLALAGFDHANHLAQGVVQLETALAQGQATREASANDRNANNRWTRADFAREAPGMDWTVFLQAAGLGSQDDFVAWQPGAVKAVAALVGSESLEVWKAYLSFHLIHRYADVLPRAFAEPALVLRSAVSGSPATPRPQRALEATQLALSDAVGRMYVERYFPADQKARLQTIVASVIAAFRRRVETVSWMTPNTRALALAKLKTVYFGVGYPERWQDYSNLVIDPADAVGNLRRVADRNHRLALGRLGQNVDVTEWWMPPQRVAAILVFQQNAYNFPAALLQPPKFDPSASDAANYGAIGAIVGHEVSHFIDMLGRDWDVENRMRRWWTLEDSAGFQAAADRVVNQVSSYRPFPDVAVNGSLGQTENVADLTGLIAAFDAYRRTLGARAADREYVRQQDRQFFLGFARSWRSQTSEAGLRTQLATDNHAPDNYRIAAVRNLDAWYDAFDVRPGQKLYLAPGERVRVW
jgi:putative endopeptidase